MVFLVKFPACFYARRVLKKANKMIEYTKREKLRQMVQVGDMPIAYKRYLELGGTQHISALRKFLIGFRPFHKDGWIMYQAIMETVESRLTKHPVPQQVLRDLEQRLAL
jgi:hypothetical protein